MAGAPGGEEAARGAAGSDGCGQEPAAPVCSGALALRRATSLLASARQADAQGERQQACGLYAELLGVQRSLARAPLGSIGKSLRDVAASVESRLQQLRSELGEGDSTTCSSGSRPPTNRSSSKNGAPAGAPPGRSCRAALEERAAPPTSCWSPRPEGQAAGGAPGGGPAAASPRGWDAAPAGDFPVSARERHARGGARPCTQDGSRRHHRTADDGLRRQQQPLDGVRPSTREDLRVQRAISGRRGTPEREARRASGEPRPSTREAERRGQDVSVRRLGARPRRREQRPGEAAGRAGSGTPRGARGLWPEADESVELLE